MSKYFGLITGAGGLIGIAHAEALLENNINIVITDVDKKKLNLVFTKLKKKFNKHQIIKYQLDLNNVQEIQDFFVNLNKKKIIIKYLINNACVDSKPDLKQKKLKNISDQWNLELNIGLRSIYLLIELFSQHMLKLKDGIIINMASDLSIIAPNQEIYKRQFPKFKKPATYSAIKHGVVGLTKYYASLYAQSNIRCNCISPSGVDNKQPKKFKNDLLKLIPLKRLSSLDDIKNVVNFLIDKKSSYMTGQNIVIDGGRTII